MRRRERGNRVVVAFEEVPVRGVRVVDIGAPVTTGVGCSSVGANEGFCATRIPRTTSSYLDDQNDYANTSVVLNLPIRLDGGDGNDDLDSGQNQFAVQDGGPGAACSRGQARPSTTRRARIPSP